MDRAERDKKLLRAGKHYAAAYYLFSIAMVHIDEGDEEINSVGLFHREVKQLATRTQKAFDDFHRNFKNKFIPKEAGAVILRDYDELCAGIEKVLDLQLN